MWGHLFIRTLYPQADRGTLATGVIVSCPRICMAFLISHLFSVFIDQWSANGFRYPAFGKVSLLKIP